MESSSSTGLGEKRTGTGSGVWQTYETAGKDGAAAHRGVLTSSIFQASDGPAGTVAPSIAPSVAPSSVSGWLSSSVGRTRGGSKGKGVKTATGDANVTPFNLDATIPRVAGNGNGSGSGSGNSGGSGGTMKAAVTLHVHYPADDAWRVVAFPPGVLVGQARDICMLKFNVWRRIMERERKQTDSTATTRDQYGLYSPGRGEWLDALELLASCDLAADDVLELQDASAFVPTANRGKARRGASASGTTVVGSSVVEPRKAEPEESLLRLGAPPHSLHNRGSTAALERKPSLVPLPPPATAADAEGRLHYLQGKGLSTAWRALWVELHGPQLVCFKKKQARAKPVLSIELARGFRVVSPASPGSDASSVSTGGTLSSASSMSVTTNTGISDNSLLGSIASHKQLGPASVPLIIRCGAANSQVHVFCAQGSSDHDYWLRALAHVHNPPKQSGPPPPKQQQQQQQQPPPPRSSGRTRTASLASATSLPRSVRMVARREVFQIARSPSPDSDPEHHLPLPLSAPSTASSSEPAHPRPIASRDAWAAGHVALRLPGAADAADPAAADPAATVERELHSSSSVRRSRSFVSSLSRAEWPLPLLQASAAPDDASEPFVPHEKPSGSTSSSSNNSGKTARVPLSIRFPWFRRNNSNQSD
ncbi:hypothetical protein EV175_004201 [Coemansia sp. RSA 1933]|nr:hypothetical protein EV175_004201 [Coemansia sp. RSA 1933]